MIDDTICGLCGQRKMWDGDIYEGCGCHNPPYIEKKEETK